MEWALDACGWGSGPVARSCEHSRCVIDNNGLFSTGYFIRTAIMCVYVYVQSRKKHQYYEISSWLNIFMLLTLDNIAKWDYISAKSHLYPRTPRVMHGLSLPRSTLLPRHNILILWATTPPHFSPIGYDRFNHSENVRNWWWVRQSDSYIYVPLTCLTEMTCPSTVWQAFNLRASRTGIQQEAGGSWQLRLTRGNR